LIIRPRPGLLSLFFVMRGSIVPRIAPQLLGFGIYASLVVLAMRRLDVDPGSYGIAPFALLGITLSIYLGFRNDAAYDRWWEARRLWGQLLVEVRNLTRLALGVVPDAGERRALLMEVLGFAHALRGLVRRQDPAAALASLGVVPARDGGGPRGCDEMLQAVGARVAQLRRAGVIDAIDFRIFDERLAGLAAVHAGCERISTTPLPFAYTLLVHRSAWVFCVLLPIGLAPIAGWGTPLFTVLLGYSFFGLDALSEELEDPFGTEANDLPIDGLCRVCEIGVFEALGESPPPPLLPVNFQLT
jgi:putative membrane protein